MSPYRVFFASKKTPLTLYFRFQAETCRRCHVAGTLTVQYGSSVRYASEAESLPLAVETGTGDPPSLRSKDQDETNVPGMSSIYSVQYPGVRTPFVIRQKDVPRREGTQKGLLPDKTTKTCAQREYRINKHHTSMSRKPACRRASRGATISSNRTTQSRGVVIDATCHVASGSGR